MSLDTLEEPNIQRLQTAPILLNGLQELDIRHLQAALRMAPEVVDINS